jgi:hypothetical protein
MCYLKSLKGLSFNSFDFRCLRQHGVEGSCEQLCTMSSCTHWWEIEPKSYSGACKFIMYAMWVCHQCSTSWHMGCA